MDLLQDYISVLPPTMFIVMMFCAGLAGGASHCISMCGPLVIGQAAARSPHFPATMKMCRLRAGSMLPYHIGRAVTYSAMTFIAALLAQHTHHIPAMRYLAAALVLLAAIMFGLYAVKDIVSRAGKIATSAAFSTTKTTTESFIWRRIYMRILAKPPIGGRSLISGLLLGFLPCSMIYAAIGASIGVAAEMGVFVSVLATFAFAIGTAPALIVVGMMGSTAMSYAHKFIRIIAPVILLLNALLLIIMAYNMLP